MSETNPGRKLKIIEDSISEEGKRLTTFQTSYWRAIHAEVLTHRVFSRNASSSRAIPVSKMIKSGMSGIVLPTRWGKNKPGMQADIENLSGTDAKMAEMIWRTAAQHCLNASQQLADLGLHKQWANRMTEWFSNIDVIITATELDNFLELRHHHAAQPEIFELADDITNAISASTPKLLRVGEWHLPYIHEWERSHHSLDVLKKMSAARCARVSYRNHDGTTPSLEEDLKLYERLVGTWPIHASPIEHQATPDVKKRIWYRGFQKDWAEPKLHGNFVGWKQNRKYLELGTSPLIYK